MSLPSKASSTKYAHSEKIESRRKALFPSSEKADNDLGHMSPIHSDISNFSESALNELENEADVKLRKFFQYNLNDYVFFDQQPSESNKTSTADPTNITFIKSPLHSLIATPILYSPMHEKSPSDTLKTPHDMSTVKVNQKLAKRKLAAEKSEDENQHEAKHAKLMDSSKSRVRTALFPDDVLPVLSVKNFYPKESHSCAKTSPTSTTTTTMTRNHQKIHVRANKPSKKRYGEINGGVRHNIRKPKRKNIAKATLKMMQKSQKALSDITSIKRTPIEQSENKENCNFFKSLRSRMNQPASEREPVTAIIDAEVLFSPTTEMCDMASAMQINSPKRAKLNITKMFDEENFDNATQLSLSAKKISESAKLFPIFGEQRADNGRSSPATCKRTHSGQVKRIRAVAEDQMLLDAGQKRFGPTKCHECQIVYDAGDPTDEIMHQNYHSAANTFKFNGWKNERIVTAINYDTKIIKLIPGDSKIWWRKAQEVLAYINRELGFYDGILPIEKSQVYLYIKSKKIVGCLVAEMKLTAYKLLSTTLDIDLCSEESFNIRCGVSRIWVSPSHRRNGFAGEMLNALRRNFLHGYMLGLTEIAFSSPTEMGKQFAKKYFNTENILIYLH